MSGSSVEARVWRLSLLALGGAMSAIGGTAMAGWALSDVNAFYTAPVDHYGSPAYARQQPVADTFWQRQDGSDAIQSADATSTAISEQSAYRSAAGS